MFHSQAQNRNSPYWPPLGIHVSSYLLSEQLQAKRRSHLSEMAIHHSLFVWAIHRPPEPASESNIALPGYYYLFYQIIIGFSSDVYVSSGNQCLFVIQFYIPVHCQYWPYITLSLSEQCKDHKGSSRILLSVLSNNHWFLFRCIREFWQPVLVCHSILYTCALSILAVHHTLFVWAMHRPQKLTLESNIALPQLSVLSNNYWFLFRCIREFWQPVLVCHSILWMLKLRFTAMVTYSFHLYSRSSHHFVPWFNSLYLHVVNIGHRSHSLCLSNAQTIKANIRIKPCSSRILLSVLSNNHRFLFRCICEFRQPVLVCHSILYTYTLSILAIHHTLFVWAMHRPSKLTLESNIALPQLSVLSNNYWFLFRCIREFWQPVLVCHSILWMLKLRFTAMVTDSFHFYSRSSHHFILWFNSLYLYIVNIGHVITLSLSEQCTDHKS